MVTRLFTSTLSIFVHNANNFHLLHFTFLNFHYTIIMCARMCVRGGCYKKILKEKKKEKINKCQCSEYRHLLVIADLNLTYIVSM